MVKVLVMGFVEHLVMKYTVMLVMKLVKELNYKLGVKLIILMEEVGDDISSGYFNSVSKCIKGRVGVTASGNIG